MFPLPPHMDGCNQMHYTLFARPEHGSFPIHLYLDANSKPILEVQYPDKTTQYPTARQMLKALCGTTNPGFSLSSYFYLVNHSSQEPLLPGSFRKPPQPKDLKPFLRSRSRSRSRSRTTPQTFKGPSTLDLFKYQPPKEIGIDLSKYHTDVRKLLFSKFSYKMTRGGYDPEEVLQEVYRGILARNKGKCPFNPVKSSRGHYIHMVIECVLSNYHRKHSKRKAMEQLGMTDRNGEQVDAALVASSKQKHYPHTLDNNPILRLISMGYNKTEVSQELNIPISQVSKALRQARE